MEITKRLTKSVIRLETDTQSVGTGFFFSFAMKDEKFVPAIVTNRHVLLGVKKLKFKLSATRNNKDIAETRIITNVDEAVIFHPNEDIDLAVIPVFSMLEKFREAHGVPPEISYLDNSLIPDSDFIQNIKAVEDTLVIGYPNGLWDSINNQPLVRRGITASDFKIDYENKPQFIIDCSIFPGSSGSPVFHLIDGLHTDGLGNVNLGGQRVSLLGINSAVFIQDVSGNLVPTSIPNDIGVHVSVPINLGIIVKSSELEAFEKILWKRAYGENKP